MERWCLRGERAQVPPMPSTNERKALWFLAVVLLSGSAVRFWRARIPPPAPSAVAALDRQVQRVDSARTTPRPRRGKAPRDTTSRTPRIVDVDQAAVAEIEGLPGIGPALAQRIVRYRDSAGSYGSVDALCAVRGIGPALVEKLRPVVTFSGPRRPLNDECGGGSGSAPKPAAARSRKPR